MIKSDIIVPSLIGLSTKEVEEFWNLPWKQGVLKDIVDIDKTTFLISSGRIVISGYSIVGPGEEILGVKPFIKQVKRKYIADLPHEIYYIDIDILIKFFLLHPRAMQSYIRMENNFGNEIISEWATVSNQWTIISDYPCYESIHVALGIAEYQTKTFETNAIYLEFESETLSVFNLIKKEPPPSITQVDDTYENLEKLLESRIIKYKENVHILNAHFLSIWKLDYEQWMAIFWILYQTYDDIIIHLGTEKIDFFYEQSNAIFAITSNRFHNLSIFNHEYNITEWPPIVEIRRKKAVHRDEKGIIEYPVKHSDLGVQFNPYDTNDAYWSWFTKMFKHILEPHSAIIIGDYFDNFAGFMALLHVLWDQSIAENLSLDNKTMILEGKSGILGGVATQCSNWKDFVQKCKRLVDYDVSNILKPIFPTTSLFSEKPISKYLTNLFPNLMQDQLKIYFPVLTQDTKDVHFLTSGFLANNLIKSTFISGFVDVKDALASQNKMENEVRSLGRTSKNDWIKLLATCFRVGFKDVVFVSFTQPHLNKQDTLSKKLLEDKTFSAGFLKISGLCSQIIQVPYSQQAHLNQKEEEIYNNIKSLIL